MEEFNATASMETSHELTRSPALIPAVLTTSSREDTEERKWSLYTAWLSAQEESEQLWHISPPVCFWQRGIERVWPGEEEKKE